MWPLLPGLTLSGSQDSPLYETSVILLGGTEGLKLLLHETEWGALQCFCLKLYNCA